MCSSSIRFLMGTLLSASTLLAMEPPDPGMIETYRQEGTLAQRVAFAKSLRNHKVSNGLAEHARYKLMKAAMDKGLVSNKILPTPPPRWRDMPTTGTVKVFTVLIDFPDYPHNEAKNSFAQVQGRIFGTGDAEVLPPYESYKTFYKTSSYNKLDLTGNVLGWYRAGYNRADMPQTSAARERLIKEALTSYDVQGQDFAQFDNNGDGKVDFFCVIWTGPDNGWANFWWGYQTAFNDDSFKLDGIGFGKYSWQWESRYRNASNVVKYDGPFSPKTMIHEQGHGLGLPDYYDYDDAVGPRGGVGGLDMMDWVGDHNCFSKWLLDWISPEVVDTTTVLTTTPASKTLRDQSTNEDALIVMPGAATLSADMTKPFGEFFMVQNRQLTGNDLNRPILGSGLLVWHVDSRLDASNFDYLYDNSFTEHKLLRLMEADGLESLEDPMVDISPDADAGDFYVSGRSIGTTTVPNTAKYDGVWTNFGIDTISASAANMTFHISTVDADLTPPTGKPSKPGAVVALDTATFTWTQGDAAEVLPGIIIGYYLQVGSTSGGNDIFDKSIGNVLTKTISDLGIHDGQSVFARVRAMNTAGLFTEWSDVSDPALITLPVFAASSVLDNTALTFKTVGTWQADGDFYHTGDSSAQGLCADNSQTTIQTVVTGPGDLSFWWRASTERDFDYYSIMIDGVVSERISGEQEWAQKTVAIPAGRHVIGWRWAKDSNTTGMLDSVWLDDVQFSAKPDPNENGTQDILDLAYFAWAYGSSIDAGVTNWLPTCDLNGNGILDDADITMFLAAAGF